MNSRPLISIITPCYNCEEYISECIESIMGQTYNHIEHIVVDGGSSDSTLNIVKKYEKKYNMRWISEKDNGMYDAISKGFAMATGDIFAWLNADDMYMPWACELVSLVMNQTKARWVTGIPCHYNARGVAHNIARITPVFPRAFIKRGYMDGRIATFLQQESMFWSRDLWDKNGDILRRYKYAGDYHLWKRFAQTEDLYTLDSILSGFRIHPNQKSSDREKYYAEIGKPSFFDNVLSKTRIIPLFCMISSLTTKNLRIKTRDYVLKAVADETI